MRHWGKLLPWLRPLRLVIGIVAVLLSVKLAHLYQRSNGTLSMIGSAKRAIVTEARAAGGRQPAAPAVQAPPVVPDTVPASSPDPGISDAERLVLLDLRARRTAIDAREHTLMTREAVLAAAERRMSERVDQLTALQARLEQLDRVRRERDEANWRGLVKTYETMRPRDAAAILNDMEMPVLLDLLDRMKEAKAAQILSAMAPDRARNATAQLVQMRLDPDAASGAKAAAGPAQTVLPQ